MLERTSFNQINRNNKPIVLFGAGNVASKTIEKLEKSKIECIVDNASIMQGKLYDDFEVRQPTKLNNDNFILICSSGISEISNQLTNMGFEANKDFAVSPILNDQLLIDKLEKVQQTLYFTCGGVEKKEPLAGGGFYRCSINEAKITLEKLHSGTCYGITKIGPDVYFIDTNRGVFRLSEDEMSKVSDLKEASRAHGFGFCSNKKRFYVVCTNLDAILEYDENFKFKNKFNVSQKFQSTGKSAHHCNDILVKNDSLYVTMFSSTGNWKNDCFDGCIAELSTKTGQRLNDICSDLYMPHNVSFYDGSIHVLDSLAGHLRFNNLNIEGTFPAFTRGLSYNNGYYFIGQSKNRNHSRVMGLSNNISIDCGIIIFDSELKISRFIQFPNEIGQIHHILCI